MAKVTIQYWAAAKEAAGIDREEGSRRGRWRRRSR